MEAEPTGQEKPLVIKTRKLMHTPFPTPVGAKVGEAWWNSNDKRMADTLIASCLSPLVNLTILGLSQFHDIEIIQLPRPRPFSYVPFVITKIKTLKDIDELSVQELIHRGQGDPRIIPSLSQLRRTSLDELPQIYDVLGGRLALFGPRPPTDEEMSYILEHRYENPFVSFLNHLRNGLRLGVISPYTIGGRKLIPDIETRILLELLYAEDASFAVEMNMLFHVAGAIMSQRGAY